MVVSAQPLDDFLIELDFFFLGRKEVMETPSLDLFARASFAIGRLRREAAIGRVHHAEGHRNAISSDVPTEASMKQASQTRKDRKPRHVFLIEHCSALLGMPAREPTGIPVALRICT